jgi:hypothetical protein
MMQLQQTILTSDSLGSVRGQVLEYFEQNDYKLTSLDPNTLLFERRAAKESPGLPPANARVALSSAHERTRLLVDWLILSESHLQPDEEQPFQREMQGLVELVHGELLPQTPPLAEQTGPPTTQHLQMVRSLLNIESRFKSGADWFYWVAALSVINSIIFRVGGSFNFIFGLGLTQTVDAVDWLVVQEFPSANASSVHALSLVLVLLISGLFAFFGLMSRRKVQWIYLTGMVLYLVDGLILLLFKEFLSAAFHIYALVGLFRGYQALRTLRTLEKSASQNEEQA